MLLLFIPTLSPIFHLVSRGYCYFSSLISFYGICELLRFRYKQLDVLGQIVLFMRKITLRNLSAKYYSNFNYLFALILGIWEVKNQYCKLSCFLSLQDLQNVLFKLWDFQECMCGLVILNAQLMIHLLAHRTDHRCKQYITEVKVPVCKLGVVLLQSSKTSTR